MKFILLFLVLLSPGLAQSQTGQELLDRCSHYVAGKSGEELEPAQMIKATSCFSYIDGFGAADSLSPLEHEGKRMFCVPEQVSIKEAATSIIEWMQANPEKLGYPARHVVAMALISTFPCKT